MKTFVTPLFVMALLVIAAPASAATIFVQEGFEVGEGFPAASQVDANANWTLGGDSVPGGSVGLGNINGNNVNSGVQSLEMVTTSDEPLLRVHWVRDLSSTASVATPMTTATVSLSINYNYDITKHYAQDTFIYVTSHLGDGPTPTNRVAQIRLNGGVYDWKFGAASYGSGASGSNVRNDLWHDLDMVFDFAGDTVTYFLDGFMEKVDQLPIGTLVGTGGLGQLRLENGINGPSGVETNVTYVDDVLFTAEIVPEPATIGLMVIGAGLMVLRRKRA